MTLNDAIELQHTLTVDNKRAVEITVEDEDMALRVNDFMSHGKRMRPFTPNWPRALVWIHPYDKYGAKIPSISAMKGTAATD